jgi:hypothetical protein
MHATSAPDLDSAPVAAKAKQRRLRASNVKRRLWAESRGTLHPWNLFQFCGPPWWQPEPECPPSYVGGEPGGVEEIGGEVSNCSIRDRPVAKDGDSKFVGFAPNPFEGVVQHMADLNAELCIWLHGDGIGHSVDHDIVELGDSPPQGLQDVLYSSDQAPEVAHLCAARERLTMWLLHLSKAADLARKVEEAPQNRNDPERTEIQFLEDYHCLLDPVGIAENKEQNRIDEEEWDDMEVQWLGHLFVFARPLFLLSIQNAPETTRKKLISLAVKVAPHSSDDSLYKSHFEDRYFSGHEGAWAWQYEVPDVEDVNDPQEGMLLPLLHALRLFVKLAS